MVTKEQFCELKNLRAEHNLDPVFVPYVGKEWHNGPRVMICGKATYGWEGEGTIEVQQGHADKFVNDDLVPGVYGSAFWIYVWELIHACLYSDQDLPDFTELPRMHPENKKRRKDLAGHLYWTNLAKVGKNNGNLPNDLLNQHAKFFTAILIGEIKRHHPRVVVLTTGSYGYNLMTKNLVCEGDWIQDGRPFGQCWCFKSHDFWYCWSEGLSTWLIWTRHPQGWEREARRDAVKCVTQFAAQITNRVV